MDPIELLDQHLHWTMLLESLFNEDDCMIVNPTILIQYDKCALGKWIITQENTDIASLKTFQDLNNCHKAFHTLAGKVIFNFQSGHIEEAKDLESDFIRLSRRIVSLIQQLQKEIDTV
jgi:hypothetical protein